MKTLRNKKNQKQNAAHSRLSNLRSTSGQVVVEYVLLILIASMVYLLMSQALVKKDANDATSIPTSPDDGQSGAVIKNWNYIINIIGQDHADDVD